MCFLAAVVIINLDKKATEYMEYFKKYKLSTQITIYKFILSSIAMNAMERNLLFYAYKSYNINKNGKHLKMFRSYRNQMSLFSRLECRMTFELAQRRGPSSRFVLEISSAMLARTCWIFRGTYMMSGLSKRVDYCSKF